MDVLLAGASVRHTPTKNRKPAGTKEKLKESEKMSERRTDGQKRGRGEKARGGGGGWGGANFFFLFGAKFRTYTTSESKLLGHNNFLKKISKKVHHFGVFQKSPNTPKIVSSIVTHQEIFFSPQISYIVSYIE